jgi:hypothetical protein
MDTIESIVAWEARMCKLNPELQAPVAFLYNKTDYLQKLRGDLDYLYKSSLMDTFEFARNADPLLINPAAVHVKSPEKFAHKADVPIAVE